MSKMDGRRSVSERPPAAILPPKEVLPADQIESVVKEVLWSTPFIDMHTHLFAPALGKLGLWGIDDLLTYHYLEAEFFRSSDIIPERYWNLSKREKADAIWQVLFIENTPISEATRGIITVLKAFEIYPPTVRLWKRQDHSFNLGKLMCIPEKCWKWLASAPW